MGISVQVFLLAFMSQIVVMSAETDPTDSAALGSIRQSWQNLPSNWNNSDPCSGWGGIVCTGPRVTTLNLQGINVKGTEFGDISSLTALQYLDLSNNKGLKGTLPLTIGNLKSLTILILVGCDFSGPIPETIGSLQNLVLLSLNNNSFSGSIPPSIGKLSKLFRLDLDDNKLEGTIPVSDGNLPGLDMLIETRHFHFGSNKLSGPIPPGLFSSSMKLLHIVLDNNQLTGSLPSTVGLVQTLETIRVDSNSLNGPVPNLNNLTRLRELYLANNKLTGALPNLTGMSNLFYVDLSNNSFTPGDLPSWVTSLGSLISLLMEGTGITGAIPVELFSTPTLTTIVLSNNQLSGTLDVGTSNSNGLRLIDVQKNSISTLTRRPDNNTKLLLGGNPICNAVISTETYCEVPKIDPPASITPSPSNCGPGFCSSDKTLSPNCRCAVPYTGILHYIFFSFSNENSTYFATTQEFLNAVFESRQLHVDSFTLTMIPKIESYFYRQFRLQVFPKGEETFNRTGVSHIGSLLNRQDFPNITNYYGPFYFTDESYAPFRDAEPKKSSNSGIIIGAAVGSSVLVLLLIGVGYYAYRQKERILKMIRLCYPFASWIPEEGSGGIPQLQEARFFSYAELVKCTNNFSDENCIGVGGYGKVYKGLLPSGQLIAIKRAQKGSQQGANEFKNEIELLSRIHHKNVVKLEGFCYEQGEQMLVYEYIPNGNLRESISGTSGIHLNWMRRLKVALGSAGGIAYLHDQANPPIIHRDIKSNNILLDGNLNGKVADFGLSKPMGDSQKGYVSTQVKGTMGYLDPEYKMNHQLTEKSDVFGFGIVLLELITARKPLEVGRHIVKEVKYAIERSKVSNDYREIVDPNIDSVPIGLEKLLELAMRCVRDSGADRPTMGEVVREIENIVKFADSNPNSSSVYTAGEASTNNYFGDKDLHGPSDDSLNNYRGNKDLFSYTAGR